MDKKSKVKVENTTLNKYYFYLNSPDDKKAMVKVYASTIAKAKEILNDQFKFNTYTTLEPIGSLIEHGNTYRKNLIPKFNTDEINKT